MQPDLSYLALKTAKEKRVNDLVVHIPIVLYKECTDLNLVLLLPVQVVHLNKNVGSTWRLGGGVCMIAQTRLLG